MLCGVVHCSVVGSSTVVVSVLGGSAGRGGNAGSGAHIRVGRLRCSFEGQSATCIHQG